MRKVKRAVYNEEDLNMSLVASDISASFVLDCSFGKAFLASPDAQEVMSVSQSLSQSLRVGSRHFGPNCPPSKNGQLGPGQLGSGAQLSGARMSALKKWTAGPRTIGPRGPTVRGPKCLNLFSHPPRFLAIVPLKLSQSGSQVLLSIVN